MIEATFGGETTGTCDTVSNEELEKLQDYAKRGYVKCFIPFMVEGTVVWVNVLDVKLIDLPMVKRKLFDEDAERLAHLAELDETLKRR